MPGLEDLLGKQVQQHAGDPVPTSSLVDQGSVVGLYFSAHWCGPCRTFTPKLVEFFKKIGNTDHGKRFQIVFVSSDRDEEGFNDYFQEMPWLAIPFSEADRRKSLSRKFKIQGIPALVLIDGCTGKLITTQARIDLEEDPEGKSFPWQPKSVTDLLTGPLVYKSQTLDSEEVLKGKIKGLFFSAHWCPPCRVFTPHLITTYEKLKAAGKNVEFVFVSSDRSEATFKEYTEPMPWPSIPYGDPRIKQLERVFGIEGIPSLVFVDEEGEVITVQGRTCVQRDPQGKDFPWPAQPLEALDAMTAGILNDHACLVFFTDGDKSAIDLAKATMLEVAEKYKAEEKALRDTVNKLDELAFLYESDDAESEEIADSLHQFAKLWDHSPMLVLLDIPLGRIHIVRTDQQITKEVVEKLVTDFKEGKVTFKELRQ